MYKTIKLRIRTDREMKEILQDYEKVYHGALRKYILAMIAANAKLPYASIRISNAVAKNSKWQLYQSAKDRYAYFVKHQDWEFHKSSVWNIRDIRMQDQLLTLNFGKSFRVSCLVLPLACEKIEWEKLQKGKLCRVDIVHDATYWFANFLIQLDALDA